MLRGVRIVGTLVATFALMHALSSASLGGTIIRLGLGSDPLPDITFDGTTLRTIVDSDAVTLEDQDTNVDFQGFITAYAADILTPTASISLNGLTAVPPVSVPNASLVIANFTGGTFILRNPANVELLSGTLGKSSLAGTLGGPGTGGLFTTTFSTVNPGGLLAPYIKTNSLTLSMSFTDVMSGGASGFAVQLADPTKLAPFTGDVTINISADPNVPEPMTATLVLIALTAGIAANRKRR